MSSTCCGGNCGCGASCKCDSACGGCKMYPETAAGSTATTETTVLGVGPTQTGDVHGSEMAAAGAEAESGGCKCNPCTCNPCNCK